MIFYYCSTGGYGWQGGILWDEKSPNPAGWAYERLSAAGNIARLRTRRKASLVDFRFAKIKRGIPRPAGRGSGLCPENPQPFEKGWRKLQLGVRWFGQKKSVHLGARLR